VRNSHAAIEGKCGWWRNLADFMNNSAYHIAIPNLLLLFIPVVIVCIIYIRWSLTVKTLFYATGRMIAQLIFVGYALVVIFNQSNALVSSVILTIMLSVSSWIALRPIKKLRNKLYFKALLAIFGGGVPVLALVVGCVVQLKPWHMPRYLIPLAGMIFANAMNSVSLCAERFHSEKEKGQSYLIARNMAYKTGLIPLLNSFFAVGLVSIPGMMTGQILSGVSPLLAVRYQMMVMGMLLGACGISSAIYLLLLKEEK